MLSPSGITSKLKKDTPEYGDRFMPTLGTGKRQFPLTFSPLYPTPYKVLQLVHVYFMCISKILCNKEGWDLKGKTLQQILSRSCMHSAKYTVGTTQVFLSFPYYFSDSHTLTMLQFNLVWFSFLPLHWYPHLTVLYVSMTINLPRGLWKMCEFSKLWRHCSDLVQ